MYCDELWEVFFGNGVSEDRPWFGFLAVIPGDTVVPYHVMVRYGVIYNSGIWWEFRSPSRLENPYKWASRRYLRFRARRLSEKGTPPLL